MENKVQGLLMPELEQILPEAFAARIKRPGIVNAMHHEGFNKAVQATGRKKLYVAGITTEICVLFPVLQVLEEGYEVQVSADVSALLTGQSTFLAPWIDPEATLAGRRVRLLAVLLPRRPAASGAEFDPIRTSDRI